MPCSGVQLLLFCILHNSASSRAKVTRVRVTRTRAQIYEDGCRGVEITHWEALSSLTGDCLAVFTDREVKVSGWPHALMHPLHDRILTRQLLGCTLGSPPVIYNMTKTGMPTQDQLMAGSYIRHKVVKWVRTGMNMLTAFHRTQRQTRGSCSGKSLSPEGYDWISSFMVPELYMTSRDFLLQRKANVHTFSQ